MATVREVAPTTRIGPTGLVKAGGSSTAGIVGSGAIRAVGRVTATGSVTAKAVAPSGAGVLGAFTGTGATTTPLASSAILTATSALRAAGLAAGGTLRAAAGLVASSTAAGSTTPPASSPARLAGLSTVRAGAIATEPARDGAGAAGLLAKALGYGYVVDQSSARPSLLATSTLRAAGVAGLVGRGAPAPVTGALAAAGRLLTADATGTARLEATSRTNITGRTANTLAEGVSVLAGAIVAQVQTIVAQVGTAAGTVLARVLVQGRLATPFASSAEAFEESVAGVQAGFYRALDPAVVHRGSAALTATAVSIAYPGETREAAPIRTDGIVAAFRARGTGGSDATATLSSTGACVLDRRRVTTVDVNPPDAPRGTLRAAGLFTIAGVEVVPPFEGDAKPRLEASSTLRARGDLSVPTGSALLRGRSRASYLTSSAATYFDPLPLKGAARVAVDGARIQVIPPTATGKETALRGRSALHVTLASSSPVGRGALLGVATLLQAAGRIAEHSGTAPALTGTSAIAVAPGLLENLLAVTAPTTTIGALARVAASPNPAPTFQATAALSAGGRLTAEIYERVQSVGEAPLAARGRVEAVLLRFGPAPFTAAAVTTLNARGRALLNDYSVFDLFGRAGLVDTGSTVRATLVDASTLKPVEVFPLASAARVTVDPLRVRVAIDADVRGRARVAAAGRNVPTPVTGTARLSSNPSTVRAVGAVDPFVHGGAALEARAAVDGRARAGDLLVAAGVFYSGPVPLEAAAQIGAHLHLAAYAVLRGRSSILVAYPGTARLEVRSGMHVDGRGRLTVSGSRTAPTPRARGAGTGVDRSASGTSPEPSRGSTGAPRGSTSTAAGRGRSASPAVPVVDSGAPAVRR